MCVYVCVRARARAKEGRLRRASRHSVENSTVSIVVLCSLDPSSMPPFVGWSRLKDAVEHFTGHSDMLSCLPPLCPSFPP